MAKTGTESAKAPRGGSTATDKKTQAEAQSKALAVVGQQQYAVIAHDPKALTAIIRENLGNSNLKPSDLDRIKVPAGGGMAWTIPNIEGDEVAKEFSGIIVAWKEPRAYWATAFDGKNNPPDCYADDGMVGVGEPGGDCSTCPLAQFGSAPAGADGVARRGQACKQMRLLFMLRPNDLLPVVVAAPPTSIKPLKNYFMRLASKAIQYSHVVTKLTLEKQKNADGIEYSRIIPAMGERLSPEQIARVARYAADIRPALMQVTLTQDDYQEVPEAGDRQTTA